MRLIPESVHPTDFLQMSGGWWPYDMILAPSWWEYLAARYTIT